MLLMMLMLLMTMMMLTAIFVYATCFRDAMCELASWPDCQLVFSMFTMAYNVKVTIANGELQRARCQEYDKVTIVSDRCEVRFELTCPSTVSYHWKRAALVEPCLNRQLLSSTPGDALSISSIAVAIAWRRRGCRCCHASKCSRARGAPSSSVHSRAIACISLRRALSHGVK